MGGWGGEQVGLKRKKHEAVEFKGDDDDFVEDLDLKDAKEEDLQPAVQNRPARARRRPPRKGQGRRGRGVSAMGEVGDAHTNK